MQGIKGSGKPRLCSAKPALPLLETVADARFHSLAFMIEEAIVITDRKNQVRFANPAADRLFEAAPGQLIGQPFLLALNQIKPGDITVELASGRRLHLSLSLAATVWQGEVAWMASFHNNYLLGTSHPEKIETLVQRVRARLLSHLSHELRTPLNSILGFSEAMILGLYGKIHNKHYADYVQNIQNAGKKLLNLLDDLLDLARADAGQLSLEESYFDLAEAVTEALPEAKKRARGNNKILSTVTVEPVLLRGDKAKFQQALVHLLSNGFSFTPSSGYVSISSSLLDDGRLVIRVADTGRGFDKDDLASAFCPFPRLHTVEKSDPQVGAGVGLALVRQYIELHGGTVRIESQEDRGTTVTCTLPPERITLNLNPNRSTAVH